MSNRNCIYDDFVTVRDRLKSRLSLKRDIELIDIIGTNQSKFTRTKKNKIFPVEWAYCISKQYDIDLEWILTGAETKSSYKHKFDILKVIEQWLTETNESPRWFERELEKKIPDFLHWKRSKTDPDYLPDTGRSYRELMERIREIEEQNKQTEEDNNSETNSRKVA